MLSDFHDINILIPNYNNGNYLTGCLASIFSQNTTYSFLVIIIDDASTDNSINIIEDFCLKYPNKIYFISNENNCGCCETTLKLYQKINSSFFTVLDSDDMWSDNQFLERGITFLNSNSEFVSYSNNTNIFCESENTYKSYFSSSKIINGYDTTNDTFLGFGFPHTSACIFRSYVSKKMIDLMTPIISNKNENNNFLNQIYCQLYEGDTFRNVVTNWHGKQFNDYTYISGFYRIKSHNSRWSSLNKNLQNLLQFLFFIEIYFKITDNKQIKDAILKIINPISIFLKTIQINNIDLSVNYNNSKYNIIEYKQVLLHTIHMYNLLPNKENDMNNKHYLFFLPSKIVGGFEILFVNLAIALSNIGYKVSYIDYSNGHLNKLIGDNNKIHLISFPDNHPYYDSLNGSKFIIESNDDVNLIMPLTMSGEVIINLSKQSKIMYYMAHPKSIEFLTFRSRFTQEQTVSHVKDIQNHICCQDETNQVALKKITGSEHKIIPIFAKQPEISYCQKHNIKKECEINIGFLGRLDYDKIFSLINVLDNLTLYNTSFKKNIHIIGTNDMTIDSIKLITDNKSYENANINIIFTGLLLNNDKYNYLYNNVDILFAMGTSLLEGALVKIPCVLILGQSTYIKSDDKFIYLCDLTNINNGFYEEDIHDMGPFIFNNFSNIMDDIYKYNKISEIGEKCFEYCVNNHEINNTVLKVLEYFVPTADIPTADIPTEAKKWEGHHRRKKWRGRHPRKKGGRGKRGRWTLPQEKGERASHRISPPKKKGEGTSPQEKGDGGRHRRKIWRASLQEKGDGGRHRRKIWRASLQEKGERTSPQEKGERTSPKKKGERTSLQEKVERASPQEKMERASPKKKGERTSPQEKMERASPQEKMERASPQEKVEWKKKKEKRKKRKENELIMI